MIASATCGMSAVSIRQTAAKTIDSPNSRRLESSRAIRGPNAMPAAEADEHRAEQHAVGRVAAAEADHEDLARADDGAGRDEGADQADDDAADEPRTAHERSALAQQGEQAGLVLLDAPAAVARRSP